MGERTKQRNDAKLKKTKRMQLNSTLTKNDVKNEIFTYVQINAGLNVKKPKKDVRRK